MTGREAAQSVHLAQEVVQLVHLVLEHPARWLGRLWLVHRVLLQQQLWALVVEQVGGQRVCVMEAR